MAENVVICLDTSRSMYRTDLKPNRLYSSINAIKTLIKQRLKADSNSAFAIVGFSDNSKKISEFINISDNLNSILDSMKIGGSSALGVGLATSIKLIIDELRKIMAKIPRILIISDGKYTKTAIDPLKMGRLAQGLNIKIDAFRIGEISQLNILKKLCDLTRGKYYFINGEQSLNKATQDFADCNIKMGTGMDSLIEKPEFLRKIAANLFRVQDLTKDQEMRLKQLRGEADYKKCTVCFQEDDPITKGSFFLTGRYCPNCQAAFHVTCLSEWAASQKDDKLIQSGTVRCPHCFYLLKIPTEVSQVRKLRLLSGNQSYKHIKPKETEIIPAELFNIADLGDEAMYNSCPVCNYIFEENQQVVKCGNFDCESLFHLECFKKLEKGQCKNCGVKLHLY